MRAAVLHAARDIRIETRPDEPLGEGQVRLRFCAGGICGSDVHYFQQGRNGDFVVVEPLVLGHEIAGEVVALGPGATGVRVGDHVAVYPARTCGVCAYCREGRDNLCPETFFMGSASKRPHMQGGFQELLTVDARQCYPVPADLDPVYAAFGEPLAVCLHGVSRAGDLAGRSVLVIGAGPIGLILMMAARWSGAATVVSIDLVDEALAAAKRLGADEAINVASDAERLAAVSQGLDGFDVVLEASGSPAAVATAMEHVRRGGIITQVGGLPGGTVPIPAFRIMAKELDVRGSMRFTRAAFETSVRLISTGEIDVRPLLTDRQPLENVAAAIDLAADRTRAIKVMITA